MTGYLNFSPLGLESVSILDIIRFIPLSIVVSLIGYIVANEFIRYNARIRKLPGPSGPPLIGNLYQTYNKNSPEIFRQWTKQYGDVFQIQLGNVPVVVINSASAAKELLQMQGHAYISRPIFYTFHKIISGSQGFSIGTSPWDDSCKRRRKAAATALNKPKVESYVDWLDLEVRDFIKELYNYKGAPAEVTSNIYHLSLNMTMTVNYGDRISETDSSIFKEITHVEKRISYFRETNGNLQNYIPLLRLWKWNKETAEGRDIGQRRRRYNDTLFASLYKRIESSTDKPCIQGNILKDEESHLNATERYSIGISMIAGADSATPTLLWAIAHLGQHPEIQQEAYKQIKEHYKTTDRIDSRDHSIEYIKAFINEVARYYTVLRIGLPRATYTKSVYNGIEIPAGVPVYVNQWACNHDPEVYKDPFKFDINRWLDKSNDLTKGVSMGHFSFGVGRRMCPAAGLANRMLYMSVLRLIWGFEILSPVSSSTGAPISLDPLKGLKSVTAKAQPVEYKIQLIAREDADFDSYFNEAQ